MRIASAARFAEVWVIVPDEAAAKEMGAEIPEPSEGIEQKIKEKMQQMDPYKVFHNEY